MTARISRFARFRGEVGAGPDAVVSGDKKRYFEGAETNRLNSAHWVYASDIGVNAWLIQHLSTLRARAMYEARNNPMVAGVIRSYVLGVVGQRAPTLQVQSDSPRFNDALEAYWLERRDNLDLNGMLSFYDLLCQMIGYLPTCGEAVLQLVSGEDGLTRVLTQEPRRMESLIAFRNFAEGWHAVLGVKRTRTGKPISYSFRDWDEATGAGSFRYVEVPADQVIHFFECEHPGQARGIPLLASAIATGAELRDFDTATLRAARTAAEHTVLLEATGPDVEYMPVDSEIEVESGTMSTLPPGYKATQLAPEHPANGYIEFRHERLREIGRGMCMPLMMVLLDSSRMNYSSARFDGQMFTRSTASVRTRAECRVINRLVEEVTREGQALGRIPPTPPRYRLEWGWQPMPEVDPLKEAEARRTRLGSGLSTYSEECAAYGHDYLEEVLPKIAEEREARARLGVPEPEATAGPPEQQTQDAEGDDDDSADERNWWAHTAATYRGRRLGLSG